MSKACGKAARLKPRDPGERMGVAVPGRSSLPAWAPPTLVIPEGNRP